MKDYKFKMTIIIVVLLTIVVSSALTYGFYMAYRRQSDKNEITSECFNVDLTNESQSISLTNAYPVDDDEGLLGTPYTFDISNTCALDAYYYVLIDTKTDSFADSYVKLSVNSGTPKFLNATPNTVYAPEAGYSSSAIIDSGELAKNASKSFQVNLWIDSNTTYEQVAGTNWEGRIRVVSTVADIEKNK